MALGTWQSLWAWRRRAPWSLFWEKRGTMVGGGVEAGAFGEARGASDAPAQALPA